MVGPWIALDNDDVETVLGKSFSRRGSAPSPRVRGEGRDEGAGRGGSTLVIASGAKQSSWRHGSGLLRRFAPRNDDIEERSRDANAPEFCRYDAQEAEPGPVMRRRRWGWLPPDHVQPLVEHDLFGKPDATFPDHARINQDGETPTDAYSFRPHPSGCGRDPSGGRSPVGVPPRHLRQRTNATAQLQKRSSWDVAKKRALPAPACPSPAAWPQTGHSAGRTFSRSRPGAKVTSPGPREPLPLRQPA